MSYRIDYRLPNLVYAHASPRSRGGTSIFEASSITKDNAADFISETRAAETAKAMLAAAGFTILGDAPATINIAGPPGLYESYFKTSLVTQDREVIQSGAVEQRRTSTFVDTAAADVPGFIAADRSPAADHLEGVALEQPVVTMEALAVPPEVGYWHLALDDVARLLGAHEVHRQGFKGNGVRLTMVDTGWQQHPYFTAKGLSGTVVLGPQTITADVDEHGHGTCESANAFAVAPGIQFTMVKGNFTNMLGAFNTAVNQNPKPQIISNSWGYQLKYPPLAAIDQVLAVSVSLAVADGIVVVCSAGNGHHAFPAQHPEVIAAGGVYIDEDGAAQASNYASGFTSALYSPKRIVPDVSGLVGMLPSAAYIMLPCPPGSEMDRQFAAHPNPAGDDTTAFDGWVACSGTSAAAPQLAGICALLLEAHPDLKPSDVRTALEQTAREVDQGRSNPTTGGVARKGQDTATGYGLANAAAALNWLGSRPGSPVKRATKRPTK